MSGKPVLAVGLWLAVAMPSRPQAPVRQQVEAHTRQAGEYVKANRPDLAAREYQAILRLDPKNSDAQGNLGVLLFFQGDYAQAAPHLRAAVEAQPGLWKLQALLGMAEKRRGRPAAARAALEGAFPNLGDDRLRRQAGLELVELDTAAGDLEQAAVVVGALRKRLPADVEILYVARRVYGDLADDALLRLSMLAPDSARLRQLMAQELMRENNRLAALEQYRQALQLDPRASGLHFELGELYNSGDSPDAAQAEREYRAALALNPFDAKSECRLGDLAFRGTDVKKAMAHYSRCRELQPDDAEANVGVAKCLMSMEQSTQALPYLERAAQLDPLQAVTHYRLAQLYRDAGRTAEADREVAEFRRLKDLKERLKERYGQSRLQGLQREEEVTK